MTHTLLTAAYTTEWLRKVWNKRTIWDNSNSLRTQIQEISVITSHSLRLLKTIWKIIQRKEWQVKKDFQNIIKRLLIATCMWAAMPKTRTITSQSFYLKDITTTQDCIKSLITSMQQLMSNLIARVLIATSTSKISKTTRWSTKHNKSMEVVLGTIMDLLSKIATIWESNIVSSSSKM